jgi:hypothetical protein
MRKNTDGGSSVSQPENELTETPGGGTSFRRRVPAVVLAFLVTSCAASDPGSSQQEAVAPAATTPPPGWLSTSGNRILRSDNQPWMARGVNIHDTRSCNACAYQAPQVDEVKRRIDEAVDVWGADLLRLTLESYGSAGGRTHWRGLLDDPTYLADILEIVRHVGGKPGVYILVSLWVDPTFDGNGLPTAGTVAIWQHLAEVLRDESHVLFGVANEPEANFDGSRDAAVWSAMNDVVAAIRAVEDRFGTPHHMVAVQGTRQWARVLDYYVSHPITAGSGENVVYETHVYDPASTFDQRFADPSRSLPVIIGEFGPVDWPGVATMSLADCVELMDRAEALGVPYLAWTFHMRCPPNLLVDLSGRGCGVGMPLQTTDWGDLLANRLARR